jgi:hypothetical protein
MSGELQGGHESEQPKGRNIYTSLSLDGLLLIAQTTDKLDTLYLIDEALAYHSSGLPGQKGEEIRVFLDDKIVKFVERDKREADIIKEMETYFHEAQP